MDECTVRTYELSGGETCLDFTNTVSGSRHHNPKEYLRNYADLLEWSRQTGILTGEQQRRLQQLAESQPEQADEVYQRAVNLREALYRIFSAVVAEEKPLPEDTVIVNQELAAGSHRLQLEQGPHGFHWSWKDPADRLDAMLGAIAHSAALLLNSSELSQVRECASEDCTWLFMDRTKNHSRLWCDMRTCGNKSKVRRFRKRKREESAAPQ